MKYFKIKRLFKLDEKEPDAHYLVDRPSFFQRKQEHRVNVLEQLKQGKPAEYFVEWKMCVFSHIQIVPFKKQDETWYTVTVSLAGSNFKITSDCPTLPRAIECSHLFENSLRQIEGLIGFPYWKGLS